MSSFGMAAQFTSMSGASARSDRRCSIRATTSLPLPFSPVISTRDVDGAALRICSSSFFMASLSPIISSSSAAERLRRSRTCSRSLRSANA